MGYGTHGKSANARVHIGEAPYIQMEMSDMEGKVFYGIDDKKRIWMKKQLEGKVTSIYRWKDRASCINADTAAVITQHKSRHLISISSGNSRFIEPLPNIAWSTVLPFDVEETRHYEALGRQRSEYVGPSAYADFLAGNPWGTAQGIRVREILNDE